MIYFYSGTPGSGKSYHIAKEIYKALHKKQYVISNFEIDVEMVNPLCREYFIYVSNNELMNNAYKRINGKLPLGVYSYLDGLKNFSLQFFARNSRGQIKEHQCLLVLDEAQILFNPRNWNRPDRLSWIEFFRVHRHLGYDVIICSQDDKAIDKQIKGIFQTEVQHKDFRYLNNMAFLIAMLCGGHLFVQVHRVYSNKLSNDSIIKKSFSLPSRKIFRFYDTTKLF